MDIVDNGAQRTAAKRTRAFAIAETLGEEIDLGVIRPGAKLTEEALAERFGVSRGPIREALGMLARDDLVQMRPHQGAFVTELSAEEILDLYEVRAPLFATAVRLMAERFARGALAPETVEEFNARFDAIAQAEHAPAADFALATQTLSRFVIDHCGNARLRQEMRRLNRQSYLHYAELSHSDPARRSAFVGLVALLRDTFLMGETAMAAELALKTVLSNRAALLKIFAEKGAPDAEADKRGQKS